jgi:hypothetical protein
MANPCTSPYGILRDLIRIVMNVFKYNLIPLLYIYSGKKKLHSSRVEPQAWEHMHTGAVAD